MGSGSININGSGAFRIWLGEGENAFAHFAVERVDVFMFDRSFDSHGVLVDISP